jgi:hypothetical protein
MFDITFGPGEAGHGSSGSPDEPNGYRYGRGRKSTRPGAHGVVALSPFGFLDRLADLVPPPRKHRHRLPT